MRARFAIGLAIGAHVIVACRPRAQPSIAIPQVGIALAIYQPTAGQGFAMVDDRRWVELEPAGRVVFDNLDPKAELASLMIEPLAGDRTFAIGACTRQPIDPTVSPQSVEDVAKTRFDEPSEPATPTQRASVPLVSCAASGPPGRYLVRVLYRTAGLGFRARHELVMTSLERATVTSRFAIATPRWNARATVTLFDGVPGASRAPREIAHGSITLDGAISILALPPRELPSRLRRVFAGTVPEVEPDDDRSADPLNGHDTAVDVWVWVECDGVVPAGDVFVRLTIANEPVREQAIGRGSRRDTRGAIRMPLWIDPELRGRRQRISTPGDLEIIDRIVLAIANTGDATRELWIEEALRPFPQAPVVSDWPTAQQPALVNKLMRGKLVVAPGAIERRTYTLHYKR